MNRAGIACQYYRQLVKRDRQVHQGNRGIVLDAGEDRVDQIDLPLIVHPAVDMPSLLHFVADPLLPTVPRPLQEADLIAGALEGYGAARRDLEVATGQ